jgi:hypothetical protein
LLGTFKLWGMHNVKQNINEAEKYLLAASNNGDAYASYGLGMMYFLGFKRNHDRNYKKAYYYLNISSNRGYMLSKLYLGSMLMNGQGHDKNDGDVNSVDTKVEMNKELACEHLMTIAMEGGKWGDPDKLMEAGRGTDNRKYSSQNQEYQVSPSVVLVAFELKGMLGYSSAFTSSGWLWNNANDDTKKIMLSMIRSASSSTYLLTGGNEDEVIEGGGQPHGEMIHDDHYQREMEKLLRSFSETTTAKTTTSTNSNSIDDRSNFRHYEHRAMEWWVSSLQHHQNKEEVTDSMLFVGHKYNEKKNHIVACHHYSEALKSTYLSTTASSTTSKALGILGWHLLQKKSCNVKTMNEINQLVGGDGEESISYSKTSALVFAAAAEHEIIPSLSIMWYAMSYLAWIASWIG